MGSRRPETQIKRAREQALREKRERKQEKKDARAAARIAGETEGELVEGDETTVRWEREGAVGTTTPRLVPESSEQL